MQNNKPLVLMVEDSPSLIAVYLSYLKNENCQLVIKSNGAEAIDYLKNNIPFVVLLDLKLPDMDGMEILKYINRQEMPCSVVVITAHGSIDVAVDAMRFGAFDFIEKPFNAKRLLVTLRNALERQHLNNLVAEMQDSMELNHYYGFIGSSPAIQAVYRIIDSAAASKATVFITGESGTGKEVCAEAIHLQSPRRDMPFVALNCASIPRDLMESEIFGHVKGAFTGAVSQRMGLASQANGGTFFLDEICEMDLDLQAKLLRFIQTGSFTKVGGHQAEKVDIRIVCATNKDPWTEVEQGRFREDLYYRLHVIPVALPPLRERDNDPLHIARHYLGKFSQEEGKRFLGFDKKTEAKLLEYSWPGNVRQLLNVIRNVVVLYDAEIVTPDLLPAPLNRAMPALVKDTEPEDNQFPDSNTSHSSEPQPVLSLAEVEKRAIEGAIAHCDGNIPKAAHLLEVSPSTLYRKLQSWHKQL